MRPSELKSLKSVLDAIRHQLALLHQGVEEKNRSASDAQKTEHEDRQIIASAVTSLRESNDERIKTEGTQERRHGENLEEQRKLRKWTARAFIAAAIYAGLALLQWLTMKYTYTEIRNQTQATRDAAYAACVSAQIARSTAIEMQRQERDLHASTESSALQALAATQSGVALVLPVWGVMVMEPGKHAGVSFTVKNDGPTAAVNFSAKVVVVFIEKGKDPNFSYTRTNISTDMSGFLPPGTLTMGEPGRQFSTSDVKNPDGSEWIPKDSDLADLKAGKKDLVIYGKMDYKDVLGGGHHLSFCGVKHIYAAGVVVERLHPKCADYNQYKISGPASNMYSSLPRPQPTDIPEVKCIVPSSK